MALSFGWQPSSGPFLQQHLLWARFSVTLFDVQTKLRILERKFIHASEQPIERDPVVSGEIAPEHRILVPIGELAHGIADFLAPQFPCRRVGGATALWRD